MGTFYEDLRANERMVDDYRRTESLAAEVDRLKAEIARLTRVNAALLAYAECEQAYSDAAGGGSPRAVFTKHGWTYHDNEHLFVYRLRQTALALNAAKDGTL